MSERLVQWNSLNLHISGEKASALVGEVIAAKKAPITSLFLEFREGELLVEGKAKKGMSIPFEVIIREIECEGTTVHVKIADVSAFGLPIPAFLGKFVEGVGRDPSMKFDGNTNTMSIDMAKKMPRFVDVTFESIRIVKGGLDVTLGTGGADVPEGAMG